MPKTPVTVSVALADGVGVSYSTQTHGMQATAAGVSVDYKPETHELEAESAGISFTFTTKEDGLKITPKCPRSITITLAGVGVAAAVALLACIWHYAI